MRIAARLTWLGLLLCWLLSCFSSCSCFFKNADTCFRSSFCRWMIHFLTCLWMIEILRISRARKHGNKSDKRG